MTQGSSFMIGWFFQVLFWGTTKLQKERKKVFAHKRFSSKGPIIRDREGGLQNGKCLHPSPPLKGGKFLCPPFSMTRTSSSHVKFIPKLVPPLQHG